MHWSASKLIVLVAVTGLLTTGCFRRKKYENPIDKDTLQPDKVLFDRAVSDVERGRYEVARITLNTLINTYDTSEYLAKAKLLIADSWFREGGSHGLAQAEAEYKDFILFYPTMEEAAEAQEKVCNIHFDQMEKPDRDPTHALRAEDECKLVLTQFPNSKFAPLAQQKLREIQEVLAEHEYRAGHYYHAKGSFPAAANRLQGLTDHFPLYSSADEALFELAVSYQKMGPRFRDKSAAAYSKIVREYPLSARADEAKRMLETMEQPVPESDPIALARMKYEMENRKEPGMMGKVWGAMAKSPNVSRAAKSGSPQMEAYRPQIPASVPATAAGGATGVSADVSVQTVGDSTALDQKPDARMAPPGQQSQQQQGSESQPSVAGESQAQQPDAQAAPQTAPASNDDSKDSKKKKNDKKKKK